MGLDLLVHVIADLLLETVGVAQVIQLLLDGCVVCLRCRFIIVELVEFELLVAKGSLESLDPLDERLGHRDHDIDVFLVLADLVQCRMQFIYRKREVSV